jgi:chorismate-pyruvate lyase
VTAASTYAEPDLQRLWSQFSAPADLPAAEPVDGPDVPEPYHRLLVHNHHMTVTLEQHHGGPVALHVLAQRIAGDSYARRLTLSVGPDRRVVMFGIMRIDLTCVGDAVRREILSGATPLGRILIEHNVLRRVQFHQCLRFTGDGELGRLVPLPTYGRLATISCDGRPAIELLEIVAGETP